MGSGSGGPYRDTPTKALKAMLRDPTVVRDPNRKRTIETELRARRRQSEAAQHPQAKRWNPGRGDVR